MLLTVLIGSLGGVSQATGNDGLIDDRSSGTFRASIGSEWRLVSDQVMGGRSSGQMRTDKFQGRECLRMLGDVSTENNGGFIQIALDLEGPLRNAEGYDGIRLDVLGNGETYNAHLRTSDLWLPWQSYRASFTTSSGWSTVFLPFSKFEAYRTGTALRTDRLRRIGIVAIGRDFDADVCFTRAAFQRTP